MEQSELSSGAVLRSEEGGRRRAQWKKCGWMTLSSSGMERASKAAGRSRGSRGWWDGREGLSGGGDGPCEGDGVVAAVPARG